MKIWLTFLETIILRNLRLNYKIYISADLMKFNEAKCNGLGNLDLGLGNLKQKYRLRDGWIEISPAEKDLE